MVDNDPYDILGIPPGSTPEQIRAAFRRSVRQQHPDTSTTVDDDSAVRDVIAAYRLLADPDTRARYDTAQQPPSAGGRNVRVRHPSAAATPRPPGVCPACRGRGAVLSVTVCPRCEGRAEFTALEATRARVIRCGACAGRGRVESVTVCDRCGGSGAAKP